MKEMPKENNSKSMKFYCANKKAITLIALVITIILLLILAGVTINLVINEGILDMQDATDKYKQAETNEIQDLDNVVAKMDEIIGGSSIPIQPEEPKDPAVAEAGDVIKIENNIKYTSDGEGNIIPVAVGFSYAGEGTKETGFVIKNDADGNEFVWIPVEGMTYTYNRYAFLSSQPEAEIDTATNSIKISYTPGHPSYYSEAMPSDEQMSVNTYGGFYIGRYEAGILTQRTEKGEAITAPIFKKTTEETPIYAYNYVTKDQAKSLSERLYNKAEDYVISKLCSSYAWDTALKFIETKNNGWAINSVGGNYDIASGGTGELQQTGYHSVNNIYDMGGNVWEWTSENFSNIDHPYVHRGGAYYICSSSNHPAAYRINTNEASDDLRGFRVALYL